MTVNNTRAKGETMARKITMVVGFHIAAEFEAKICETLTRMLGIKSAKFDALRDEHCTTFMSDRRVRCSIARRAKLEAFIDGVRLTCIHNN